MEATKQYYILNSVTDNNYDDSENMFYPSNWNPEYSNDKEYLLRLIENDKVFFKDCIVEEVLN